MSAEAQVILAAVGLLVGGGFATLLGVLTNSLLKAQAQQGQQNAEWRAIVDEKDKQILRLETIITIRDQRIEKLEQRVAVVEERARVAEAKAIDLERQVEHGRDTGT